MGTEDSSNNEEEIEMHWVNYGKQESAWKDEVERQFQELTTKINAKQKNHNVVLMGDFNAKLEMKTSL